MAPRINAQLLSRVLSHHSPMPYADDHTRVSFPPLPNATASHRPRSGTARRAPYGLRLRQSVVGRGVARFVVVKLQKPLCSKAKLASEQVAGLQLRTATQPQIRSHNPSVLGSSPSRPTYPDLQGRHHSEPFARGLVSVLVSFPQRARPILAAASVASSGTTCE